VLADSVLVVEAYVEPNRRVERPELIQAQPSQLVVEHLTVLGAEIAIGDTPIGDGTGNAVDQLADRILTLPGLLGIAVEIL